MPLGDSFTSRPLYSAGLRYGLNNREESRFDSWKRQGSFLSSKTGRSALGRTQPPIPQVPVAVSLYLKRPDCEADYLSPFMAEVKNECS
jgi:hypothetical protein